MLLADAGLSWHTMPFHHFHLDFFSTLPSCHAWRWAALSPHTSQTSHAPRQIGMCVLRKPRLCSPLYSGQVRTCSGRTISEACRLGIIENWGAILYLDYATKQEPHCAFIWRQNWILIVIWNFRNVFLQIRVDPVICVFRQMREMSTIYTGYVSCLVWFLWDM